MPDLIDLALAEDIGSGDLTAKFFTKPAKKQLATLSMPMNAFSKSLEMPPQSSPPSARL